VDIPATSAAIPGTLVLRDSSGNFSLSAGGIADNTTFLRGDNTWATPSGAVTLTGDVTGSGTGSFATTLSASGAAAGTYRSVTVDAKGRVTAGTNPTTLSGYVITDAASSTHVHSGADITSGTVSTARLGSGTADTTTFLRGDGAWSAPSAVPTGAIIPFGMNSAPSGWLACEGAAVSRSTYADLFTAIGVTHGAGDGSTTFNVPDLRGIFIRGAGTQTIAGTSYSGTHATKQRDAFQGHRHGVTHDALKSGGSSVATSGSSVSVGSAAITTQKRLCWVCWSSWLTGITLLKSFGKMS
jgi:microcystin-dependent protein